MDLDQKSYIFGSFTRRRQSHDYLSVKKQSISLPSTIHKPTSTSSPTTIATSSSNSSSKITKKSFNTIHPIHFSNQLSTSPSTHHLKDNLICDICQRSYEDPRVLPCLHTFCLRCLLTIIVQDYEWNKDFDESSCGSGYESERRDATSSTSTYSPKTNSYTKSHLYEPEEVTQIMLICPTCKEHHILPMGIYSLPCNYVIENRLKNRKYDRDAAIQVLCDLCAYDVPASGFCKTCEKNMCPLCWNSHVRQRNTTNHEMVNLRNFLAKNKSSINNKCSAHLDYYLNMYCMSCLQLICQKCLESHSGHSYESADNLIRLYTKAVKEAIIRVRPASEQVLHSLQQVKILARKIETRCNIVQKEVEAFIEIYRQSLEDHRQTLLSQVQKTKEEKLKLINSQQFVLERRIEEANHTIQFAEELLVEGSGIQLLAFVNHILEKLEWCTDIGRQVEPRVSDCIQFLPNEQVPATLNKTPLYGMITTQTVSPQNCFLITEGFENIRVHRKTEFIVETRDIDNHPLCHGGEKLIVDVRFKDSTTRVLSTNVVDHRDGSYSISFIPDSAGQLCLTILIKGKHIKGSPFNITVRTIRQHQGIFHCCSFCSSGGSKQAVCGCGCIMAGGYKGCGHGHEGHPGKRHWSCCGNVYEHSECNTIGSSQYQFAL